MRLHLDRDRDEPLLWEETVVLEPATLGPDLVVELTPVEVRGRVDRIDGDLSGATRPGSVGRSKSASSGPAEFQVAMDLHYCQALACTRCLQPVRSEVSTHAELTVSTRSKPARSRDARAKDGTAGASKPAGAKAAPAKERRAGKVRSQKAGGGAAPTDAEVELEKDELGVLVVEGEHLDTEPLIAEQLLLEVPMKPLCAPECRGLCPRCGADRNLTPDCCSEPAGDERWEPLSALRDRLSADGR